MCSNQFEETRSTAGVYRCIFSKMLVTHSLRPGVKLQLQGKIVCRLGMLLLGPSNVKVLGGEVEDLVERNSQVKSGLLFFVKSTKPCLCFSYVCYEY